jgi:CheY-like chemotaxis protein
VSDSQQPDAPVLNQELALSHAKRILVVEDQFLNQALISEVLELEGYAVEVIYDGQMMLDKLHSPLVTPETLPHLVLMDIQLSKVDGFELIRQLKAHSLWQSVPIIAVTGIADERDRCLATGADSYLSKPLNVETVITTVRSLVDTQEEARDSSP